MIENIVSPKDEELCLRFESAEQKNIFRATLYDSVNDREWCYEHGIDYVRPDIAKAAQILYNQYGFHSKGVIQN